MSSRGWNILNIPSSIGAHKSPPKTLMRHFFRFLIRAHHRPAHLFLLVPVFVLVSQTAQPQSAGVIRGVVKEAKTGAPLKGATAKLRDVDDSTAKLIGAISDADGRFSIQNIPLNRTYQLDVGYVSFERFTRDRVRLTTEQPELDLGDISLTQIAISGGTIKVTGERPPVVVMADKTVYAVEDNPTYTATNISELLGQIPSVDVDQDGKISLRGDDNVMIMMNGRPMTMPAEQRNKMLQALPVEMVKDIEIRTTPGAQFDAKSQAGIINIVTRRTMKDMFGGNVNAGVDSREGYSAGGGLYFNGEDLTASIGGGGSRNTGTGSGVGLRLNRLDTNERRDESIGSSNSKSHSYYGYGQVDYNLSKNDLLSLSFNVAHWSSDYSAHNQHTFFSATERSVGRFFDTSNPTGGANSGGYGEASLLVKHTFEGEHKLSLNVSYNGDGYSGGGTYTGVYVRSDGTIDSLRGSSRNTDYDKTEGTIITTLDYDYPINDSLTLSLGAKNEINNLDNSTTIINRDRVTGEFILDTLQSNHYLPTNTVYAAYANVSYRPLGWLGIQGGIRVERANVAAEFASGASVISRDYTNLFPSGSVTLSITERQSLTFSYRRSIALPDIEALNPIRVKWNDFQEFSGNPDLDPEFTNSFQLNYNSFWDGGNMFSIAPYYSTTSGSIERSQQLVNGVTYTSSANFNSAYTLGTEASLTMRPMSWLNFRASGNVYNKVNRGGTIPGDVYSSATGYGSSASLNVDLLEGMTFSMIIFSNAPPTVGGTKGSGFTFWSFSLRQKLLENKLNITLRANDPFDLQKWEFVYDTPDFHNESTNKWTSRFVGLNVSYNFGTTPRMEDHRQEKTETKGSGGGGAGGGGGGNSGGGQQ